MPNSIRLPFGQFVASGNPETLNVELPASPAPGTYQNYAPGQIKGSWDYNDKTYEFAISDSGATSATPVGAVAANQLAFWKDRQAGIVTNDIRFAFRPTAPQTCVAGVYPVAIPVPAAGGNLVALLVKGRHTVAAGTTAIGPVMADTTAGTARVITATTTNPQLGIANAADSGGSVSVDFDIPTVP